MITQPTYTVRIKVTLIVNVRTIHVRTMYDIDNVQRKMYDIDNVQRTMYDIDNVQRRMYGIDNV